jgi:hypothetical protein
MNSRFESLYVGSPDVVVEILELPVKLSGDEVRVTLHNAFTRLGQITTLLQLAQSDLSRLEREIDASRRRVAGLQARVAKLEGPRPAPVSDPTASDLAANWNLPRTEEHDR